MRAAVVSAVVGAAMLVAGCASVCPSGTDERADPEGRECGTNADCEVRCACTISEGDDDELAVIVGQCQAGVCLGAPKLCEDGCGTMELAAYCRVPD